MEILKATAGIVSIVAGVILLIATPFSLADEAVDNKNRTAFKKGAGVVLLVTLSSSFLITGSLLLEDE